MRSVHELCSDWHCPYTVSKSVGNLLKFTSLRNIHSWICAVQRLQTHCDIIYLCKYIQFKLSSCTLKCTLHGTWMFTSNWNHGGISCDVHFAGHLRSNRTNVWRDKRNIQNGGGGTRTGIENRCIRTTLINFFDPLQMLTTVYYSMWWVLF